jgi:hypothetical protein
LHDRSKRYGDTGSWASRALANQLTSRKAVIRTFVDPENPSRVGLVMDIPETDAVMGAMETEAAAEAMAHDGVLPETLVILVEA